MASLIGLAPWLPPNTKSTDRPFGATRETSPPCCMNSRLIGEPTTRTLRRENPDVADSKATNTR